MRQWSYPEYGESFTLRPTRCAAPASQLIAASPSQRQAQSGGWFMTAWLPMREARSSRHRFSTLRLSHTQSVTSPKWPPSFVAHGPRLVACG